MSNSTDYINAYLENSIGMLHDYLNQVLQLKTQMKLVTDGISSKDKSIEELTKQLESVKTELDANIQSHAKDNEAVNNARANLQRLQDENDSIKHKLSEFDALVKQFADLKNEYKNKESQIHNLSSELDNVRNSKDAEINRLTSEVDNVRNSKDAEINRLTSEVDNVRNSKDADINRITSERDADINRLTSELEQMKNVVKEKDENILKLEKTIAKTAVVKKPINNKTPIQNVTKTVEENDDF